MTDDEIAEILGPSFNRVAMDGSLALRELGLAPGAKVLDVGTGRGRSAIFLASRGFDVVTGEPSTDTTHYAGHDWEDGARKVGLRDKIRFQAFDASDMPFSDGAFDAVVYFGVLHHVDAESRGAVFAESVRVLKSGGAVVFFEPRREHLEKMWVNDPGHPEAADPSLYASGHAVTETRIAGSAMDIVIFRRA